MMKTRRGRAVGSMIGLPRGAISAVRRQEGLVRGMKATELPSSFVRLTEDGPARMACLTRTGSLKIPGKTFGRGWS